MNDTLVYSDEYGIKVAKVIFLPISAWKCYKLPQITTTNGESITLNRALYRILNDGTHILQGETGKLPPKDEKLLYGLGKLDGDTTNVIPRFTTTPTDALKKQ